MPPAPSTHGEFIIDVGPGLFQGGVPSAIEQVDCKGARLAPGLVDMRVQLREPGEEHKETLRTGGAAALAGGAHLDGLPAQHLPGDRRRRGGSLIGDLGIDGLNVLFGEGLGDVFVVGPFFGDFRQIFVVLCKLLVQCIASGLVVFELALKFARQRIQSARNGEG